MMEGRIAAIKTKRLLLREFVTDDDDGYLELEGSEQAARYQSWPPRTREQARRLVLENVRSQTDSPRTIYELAVEFDGRFVGRVGSRVSQTSSAGTPGNETVERTATHHADLWFSFLPAVQGRGLATEATEAVIDALRGRMLQSEEGTSLELEIECDPRNERSRRLAERLGFERFSLTERAWECKGEWVGSLVFRKVVGGAKSVA